MKITDSKKNVRNLRALIDEEKVFDLLVRQVAEEVGIDWCDEWCSARAYYSTRDTSCGFKRDVIVEIEIDYDSIPTNGND